MQSVIEKAMEIALSQAMISDQVEIPVGAAILDKKGDILSAANNQNLATNSISGHAEIVSLDSIGRKALKENAGQLVMAVTLEPCPMCAWAIRQASIGLLVYGATNQHYGAAGSVFDLLRDSRFGNQIEVVQGKFADECARLLSESFRKMRNT